MPDLQQAPGGRVLFVDDEPHLLAGLRRMLRPQRNRWDISFASSGTEALNLIDAQPVDAIVTDMRMPGMDGAQLLAEVQRKHPATARIILSGQAEVESVLAVLGSAQQFLAKPCDIDVLTGTVDQALTVRALVNDPALRQLIGGPASASVLRAVYHQLLALSDSPSVDLTGSLLQVGESVRLKRLAGSAEEIDGLGDLALRRAAIGRAIAVREGWPPPERDLAVLSCLLRDVGGLVLAAGLPAAAARLAGQEETDPARRSEQEIAAYGCTIPQASAYLLGLWGFAPTVVQTIAVQPVIEAGPQTTRVEELLHFAQSCVLADEVLTR